MATRRKKTDESTTNSRSAYNYARNEANGSVGLSSAALSALNKGTVGQLSNRTPKYTTSRDQLRAIPSLDGMKVNTDYARRQYAANHTPIGRSLSQRDADLIDAGITSSIVAAKNQDSKTIADLMRNEGHPSLYVRDKDWVGEYGKTLEELIEDRMPGHAERAAKKQQEQGNKNKFATTLANTFEGAFVRPVEGARSTIATLIDPNSEKTKKYNQAARTYSESIANKKEGVLKNANGVGKFLYEMGTGAGERLARKAYGAPGHLLTMFDTAEQVRQSNEDRGIGGRKGAIEGLIAGGVDAALDYYGLEKNKKIAALQKSGQLGKSVAGHTIAGTGEQGITAAVNEAVDLIANGKDSVFSTNRQNYIDSGMSEQEATVRAIGDEALTITQQIGTGALMGAGMSLLPQLSGMYKKSKETPEIWLPKAKQKSSLDGVSIQAPPVNNINVEVPNLSKVNEPVIDLPKADTTETVNAPKTMNEGAAGNPKLTKEVQPLTGQELADALDNQEQRVRYIAALEEQKKTVINNKANYDENGNLTAKAQARINDIDASLNNAKATMQREAARIKGELPAEENTNVPETPKTTGKQPLQGEELAAAKKQIEDNNTAINTLKQRLQAIENDPNSKYRGEYKKAVQNKIIALEKEMKEYENKNKGLRRDIKGKETPVMEQLDKNQRNAIFGKFNSITADIYVARRLAGDTDEAKALEKECKALLKQYVKTGERDALTGFVQRLIDLDKMSREAGGTYKTENANYTYEDWYDDGNGNIGDLATRILGRGALGPVTEIHNARAAANAPVDVAPDVPASRAPIEEPIQPPTEPEMPIVQNEQPGQKTSQYYKNTMRNTELNSELDDATYREKFNEEEYKYDPTTNAGDDARGQEFIQQAGGDAAATELLLSGNYGTPESPFTTVHASAAKRLADNATAEARRLEAAGEDASDMWYQANRLHKRIRKAGTQSGEIMQLIGSWKKKTPQGAIDNLIVETNKALDKKKSTGYTSMVDDLADDIENAITKETDKKTLIQSIKDIFAKNREVSDYDTTKYEQQVLDFINDPKNTKASVSDLAQEAGRIVKKGMGVSTLTAKEERAMLDLLEAASKYEQGSRSFNELVTKAMMIYDETLPSSTGEKVRSLLYDNMLASLKTAITRNFGGNVLANTVENATTPLQVAADWAVGKFTGNRTRTFSKNAIVQGAKGLAKGFDDWRLDVMKGINTARSGQDSMKETLDAVHKSFKTQSDNKIVKGINKVGAAYDRVVRKAMEVGDRPIYEAKYAATKAELYDLIDRFGDAGLRSGLPLKSKDIPTDELVEAIAVNEALESVLQNNTKLKEGAKGIKAALKNISEEIAGVDVFSMITPFVEVPGNMASRFLQYTPFGFLGNLGRSVAEKKYYGSVNQRRMTGELGRNVMGQLMLGGGMALASNGFISDPYSDDPDEKKMQQNNGYKEYALQTSDGSVQKDISDVPVLGPMLKFSKQEYDALKEGGVLEALKEMPNAAGAATIDSLFQGLNKLTGSNMQYSRDNSKSMLGNAIDALESSVPSMAIPSIVRQTAQYMDPYKRDLGDYGTHEYNKNMFLNGLPVLRERLLDPKVDTSGNPIKSVGGKTGADRLVSNYLSPWETVHPYENISDAQKYGLKLKELTGGEYNPLPRVIKKNDITGIKGYNKDNYSHEDLAGFQDSYYNSNDEIANALMRKQWFQELSPQQQSKYLDMVYAENLAAEKDKFIRSKMSAKEIEAAGKDIYTADSALAKIIKSDDDKHTGALQYIEDNAKLDSLNEKYGTDVSYSTYRKWEDKYRGGGETYVANINAAKALDMDIDDYLKRNQNYAGGAAGYRQDQQTAIDYGFVDKDGDPNLDAYNKAVSIVGDSEDAINSYLDFQDQGYTKMEQKVPYVMNSNDFSDAQKGMLITGKTDPSTLDGNVVNEMYRLNGWEGVYQWYLLKYQANFEYGDGKGGITKKEKAAVLADNNNPYVRSLSDEQRNLLANSKW